MQDAGVSKQPIYIGQCSKHHQAFEVFANSLIANSPAVFLLYNSVAASAVWGCIQAQPGWQEDDLPVPPRRAAVLLHRTYRPDRFQVIFTTFTDQIPFRSFSVWDWTWIALAGIDLCIQCTSLYDVGVSPKENLLIGIDPSPFPKHHALFPYVVPVKGFQPAASCAFKVMCSLHAG